MDYTPETMIVTAYVGYRGAIYMRQFCEAEFAGVRGLVEFAREQEQEMRDHLRRTLADAGEAAGMAALGGIRYAAAMELVQ